MHRFVKCHWDYVRWAITGIILAIAMMAAVLKSKIIGDVLLDTVMVALTTGAFLSLVRVFFVCLLMSFAEKKCRGKA